MNASQSGWSVSKRGQLVQDGKQTPPPTRNPTRKSSLLSPTEAVFHSLLRDSGEQCSNS
jgi:hypothetical protein